MCPTWGRNDNTKKKREVDERQMQRDSDRTGPGENDRWAGKRRVGRERHCRSAGALNV